MIASFDHRSRHIERFVLRRGLSVDDHRSPGLLMRKDGRLTVFYMGPGRKTMLYRRSSNAEDVRSWGPEHTLPTNTRGNRGYTYPNPMYLSAEKRTYLFWRGGQWWPAFSRHTEKGRWTPARTLLRISGQRPYLKFHSDGVKRIHIAYTEGNAGSFVNSIYYARRPQHPRGDRRARTTATCRVGDAAPSARHGARGCRGRCGARTPGSGSGHWAIGRPDPRSHPHSSSAPPFSALPGSWDRSTSCPNRATAWSSSSGRCMNST